MSMRRKRQVTAGGNVSWMGRPADWFTGLRLLLVPLVLWLGLIGQGRLIGIALIFAGLSDFLDGYIAKRLGQQSAHGAWLDALADGLLLVAAAACLEMVHPNILSENTPLVAAMFAAFTASLLVGLIKFHQLGNLHLYSSKVAGGLLYSFALITLLVGAYEPPLLKLAAAALIVSSLETVLAQLLASGANEDVGSVLRALIRRADVETIQATGSASKHRSQIPHASKEVLNNTSPAPSSPTSAVPTANENKP
jgi:CDP-diacylglycerol--glycerol-3-phosphate 3-phosphatidyltransferase